MASLFPPGFDPAKSAEELGRICRETGPKLTAILRNCDFISGTGDDKSSMMAVQDVLLENLIAEIMRDRRPIERLVFWKIVLDMLMERE